MISCTGCTGCKGYFNLRADSLLSILFEKPCVACAGCAGEKI